jgi:hypothetical protein
LLNAIVLEVAVVSSQQSFTEFAEAIDRAKSLLLVTHVVSDSLFANVFRTQDRDMSAFGKSIQWMTAGQRKCQRLRWKRRRARMRRSWDAPAKQNLSQNDRVITSLIMRRKDECNPSSLGESA